MGFPFTEMYPVRRRYDKWAELKQVIFDPRFKFQDELENEDWFDEAKVNDDLQQGLIRDHSPNDITEKFLQKMLAKRCAPRRNFILVLVGPPGAGKTVLAATLTWEVRKLIPDAEYEVTTSENQLIDSFVAGKQRHKVTIFDENLVSTDVGKNTVATHVNNFFKELREHEHNLVYEVKYFEHLDFATYYIILFGYNEETGETRALVRSQRGHYLGMIILQKEYDEAFFEPFRVAKQISFEALQRTRGKVDAFDGLNKEEVAQFLIATITENNLCATRNSEVVEIFDMHEFKDKHPDVVIPMREIKEEIARQVLIRLRSNKQPKDRDSGQRNPPAKVLSEEHWIDQGGLQERLVRLGKRFAKANGEIVIIPEPFYTTFKLKCEHNSNLSVSRDAKISTGSASNYLAEVQQNWLGDLVEAAYNEQLTEEGEYFTWQGGNSDEPDFTIYHDKEKKRVKEYRSLKGYVYFRRNKALTEIGKKERAYAKRDGVPLFEHCYEIDAKDHSEMWHKFQVDLNDDDDGPGAQPADPPTEMGVSTPSPPSPAPGPLPLSSLPHTLEGGCSTVMAEPATKKKRRRHRR